MGERSMQKITLENKSRKICAFSGDEKNLIVVTQDARYYMYSVQGGECLVHKDGLSLFS